MAWLFSALGNAAGAVSGAATGGIGSMLGALGGGGAANAATQGGGVPAVSNVASSAAPAASTVPQNWDSTTPPGGFQPNPPGIAQRLGAVMKAYGNAQVAPYKKLFRGDMDQDEMVAFIMSQRRDEQKDRKLPLPTMRGGQTIQGRRSRRGSRLPF